MAPPRILFVSTIPAYWGGSEVLWSQAALAARRCGHAVGAFFPFYKTIPSVEALRRSGVELGFGSPTPRPWWRRNPFDNPDPRDRFRAFLDRFRPHLAVITQGSTTDGWAEMRDCRAANVPYAIINQAVEPGYHNDETWRGLREAYAETSARHVFFVSQENREALTGYLGADLPHSSVIANAYACPYHAPTAWPDSTPTYALAMVGRLEPDQKGHDILIDAIATPTWRDRPVRFNLYGEGCCRESLGARAAYRGVRNIHFRGTASAEEIWRENHALLLPSRYEGQSLAMLEAMLHGRPVFATPVGGTRACVVDGVTGFRAEASNTAAFAACLERAWDERERWKTMGNNASAHVRTIAAEEPGADFIERLRPLFTPDSA